MNTSTSLPYNIVLLPDQSVTTKAVALSERLQTADALYVLGNNTCVPHNSLYMTQLKQSDLQKVITILTDIAASTLAPQANATNYFQALGYIDIEYQRTQALADLQATVIAAVNPIRDGMRQKDEVRLRTATGKVRQNLELYGYRAAGELFRPHVSLTRFSNEQPIKTNHLPQPSDFNGTFTGIGIFEMGDNGTCARKVAVVPFTQ